jgi:hypothetical protein
MNPSPSHRIISLALSTVAVLAAMPLFSFVSSDTERYREDIEKCQREGDDIGLYEAMERQSLANPAGPESALFMNSTEKLSRTVGPERMEKALLRLMEKLQASTGPDRDSSLLRAKISLHRLCSMYRPEKSLELTRELCTITDWIILGPYRKYGPGDIDHPFLPELILDVSRNKNSKAASPDLFSGTINISKYLFPDSGIAYAVTSFRHKGPAKLRIFAESRYRAYINGREVLRNTGDDYRNLRIINLDDAAGITLMLKLYSDPRWSFKVIITDEKELVFRPEAVNNRVFRDHVEVVQCDEFSPDSFRITGEAVSFRAYEAMGDLCSGMDSIEAISWYRKSLAEKDSMTARYKLADTMVRLSAGNRSSANYIEGWRIMDAIIDREPGFAPARFKKLQRCIENLDHDGAIMTGRALLASSPGHLMTYHDMLRLYSQLNFVKEFLDLSERFKKQFPDSIIPLTTEAEFWAGRDRTKYSEIHEEILRRCFRKDSFIRLVRAAGEKGEYIQALSRLDTESTRGDWSDERIDLLMKKKDYRKARTMIFSGAIQRDDPSLYFRLGIIDFFRNMDSSMNWEKMLHLNPSFFSISDYLLFMSDGRFINPFSEFGLGDEEIGALIKEKERGDDPATVLSRKYIFRLNRDGSSRVFCDELVHVHNSRGVENRGEYRVPFRGKFYPIRARVYYGEKEFHDSYTAHMVDEDTYVSISSIREDSFLHISYIVDDPIRDPRLTTFFSLPVTLLQNYEEAVKNVTCTVIAPEDITVRFLHDRKRDVSVQKGEGLAHYSFSLKDLPSVQEEYNSGSDAACLPYFAFTTMEDTQDLARWYHGLIQGSSDEIRDHDEILKLKGDRIEETISRVYNFVARNIATQTNILYYPGRPEDTLYIKRGTPEDKTILAKSILDSFGIRSSLALIPNRFISRDPRFCSPAVFTHALLYVPLQKDRGIWLDFSSPHIPCGSVNGEADASTALILLKNSTAWRKVEGAGSSGMQNRYRLAIRENGSGSLEILSDFTGEYGAIRDFFHDPLQRESHINRYHMKILPSMEIDSYELHNLDDLAIPLRLAVKGTSPRMAIVSDRDVVLQPVINKSGIYRYVRYHQRKHPLWIPAPIHETEEYEYLLPVSRIGDGVSEDLSVNSKFGKAHLRIASGKEPNVLLISKQIEVNPVIIDPSEYNEFLKFCLDIKKLENTTVSLVRK